MHEELYQYFIQHKQLNVPGIGTFLLERKPATTDFPNKQFLPPAYSVVLQHNNVVPAKSFFSWLGAALNISDREAVIRFNEFAYETKKQVTDGNKINWNGIGILSSGLAGEIRFEPAFKNSSFEAPVKAEKVIRENASHFVRVGEEEKTSAEMTELLTKVDENRSNWWVAAVIAGLLAFIFIGWYLSEKGVSVAATGLQQKLSPAVSSETYKTLP